MIRSRRPLALMLLAVLVSGFPAFAQDSDFQRRVQEQQRENERRMEESRREAERQREEWDRQREEYARERAEEARERERAIENQRRRDELQAERERAQADADRDRAQAYEPPPLAPVYRPPAGVSPGQSSVTPVKITQISIEGEMPRPAESINWKAWWDGMLRGFAVGAILGGLLFLMGGWIRKRDLTPRESNQVLTITVVVIMLCVLESVHGPGAPGAAPAAAPSLALRRFESSEGRFSVGMPEPRTRATAMAMGLPITQYTYVTKDGAYVVGFFDIAAWMSRGPGQEGVSLDNGCTGAVQNMNGGGPARETRRTPIELAGGYPGREVEGELANGSGRFLFRAYMVKNRFYFLTATGVPAWVASPDARRFLDSFGVTP